MCTTRHRPFGGCSPSSALTTLDRVTAPKRRNTGKTIIAVVVGVVLWVCGFGTVANLISDDDKPRPAAQPSASVGRLAAPVDDLDPTSASPAPTSAAPAPSSVTPSPSRSASPRPTVKRTSSPKPTAKRTTSAPRTTAPSIRTGVHPGAFCKPAGALGRTSTGKLMVCKRTAEDERLRWRAA